MTALPQSPIATPADSPPVPRITRVRGALGAMVGALIAVACATGFVFMLQDGMASTEADKPGPLLVVQTGYFMLFGVMCMIGGVQMFRKGSIAKPFGLALFAMTIVFVNLGWLWDLF